MEKTLEVNFSDIEIKDVGGNLIPDCHKIVAEKIHRSPSTRYDLIPIANDIYAGKSVSLRSEDVEEIEAILMNPTNGLCLGARYHLKEFFKRIKAEQE